MSFDTDFLSSFANSPITLSILVVGALAGLLIWKGLPLLRTYNVGYDKIRSGIEDIKLCCTNNAKDILRLTFYNESLGIVERLVAGKRYLACGGNGLTGKAIDELAAEHPAEWEMIQHLSKAIEADVRS
jgi:hypothetical protein